MRKLYLVWNEDRTEFAGFKDKNDAYDAAGISRASESASTLAEFFRSNYADEDIFDEPEKVFEIQEIEL